MLHLWSILKLVIGYNLYLAMRQISPTHLNAYKSGQLSKLFKVIIEDPELSFEIRKDNQVMIYYRKDKILTIKESKKGDFNFEILDPEYYKGELVLQLSSIKIIRIIHCSILPIYVPILIKPRS